jgi:hypothetical protein
MAKWKSKKIHSEEQLRDLVTYDPETGHILTRPQRIGATVWMSSRKDWRTRIVHIGGRHYLEHRLAWFLMTGEYPPNDMVVDHINGDSTDNRWCNLRLATSSENQRNRTRINKNNGAGLTGAYQNRKEYSKRWFSSIGGKHLGSFSTKEEAHEAYRKAAIEKYGSFAPDRLKR